MSTKESVQQLQDLATDLDKQIATLPEWVVALVNRRVMAAKLLEMHLHLQAFERQCATTQTLPMLLQKQAG